MAVQRGQVDGSSAWRQGTHGIPPLPGEAQAAAAARTSHDSGRTGCMPPARAARRRCRPRPHSPRAPGSAAPARTEPSEGSHSSTAPARAACRAGPSWRPRPGPAAAGVSETGGGSRPGSTSSSCVCVLTSWKQSAEVPTAPCSQLGGEPQRACAVLCSPAGPWTAAPWPSGAGAGGPPAPAHPAAHCGRKGGRGQQRERARRQISARVCAVRCPEPTADAALHGAGMVPHPAAADDARRARHWSAAAWRQPGQPHLLLVRYGLSSA